MATIRNTSGQDLDVPGYGRVNKDELLEVADGDVYGFTVSANWAPVDLAADAAHADGAADEAAAVEAERIERGIPAPGDEQDADQGKPPKAKDIVASLGNLDHASVRAILDAERLLAAPRKTVVEAAVARLATFTPVE